MDNAYSGLILLTYKGKALLVRKEDNSTQKVEHPWSFIGVVKQNKESFEHAFVKRAEKEMGIKIDKIEFISDSYYHARLTDDNVNQIERSEGQVLSFFTFKELETLFLSTSTARFVSKHPLPTQAYY